MSILWFNIKSKEVRVAESEPMISAMYNSSDMGANSHQGQDFGWRLHPEVAVKVRGIKTDPKKLESIATRYAIPIEDVDDKRILAYISDTNRSAGVEDRTLADFEDEYREEIRRLEASPLTKLAK